MEQNIPKSMQTAFERKAHPYYMWEGIQQIPEGLEDLLKPENRKNVAKAAQAIYQKSPVHFFGCGTSYFASLAAMYIFHDLCEVQAIAANAFEFIAYPPPHLAEGAAVGISHTGSTPSVVQAIDLAKSLGAATVGFTDVEQSALGTAAENILPSCLGVEPALPKTRSYVASLMRAYLLAAELAKQEGKNAQEYFDVLEEAPGIARKVLADNEEAMRYLAYRTDLPNKIVTVGGGPQWATANEVSLKLIESALYNSDAWELEEAVHGTWASTRSGDLIIIPAMSGGSLLKCQKLAIGMKTIGATVWVLTNDGQANFECDQRTALPSGIPEMIMPMFAILPLYQFTYFLALRQGIHPDNMNLVDPRYLKARTLMREFIQKQV